MRLSPSSSHSLRNVFYNNFSVHDITEPLMSCGDHEATDAIASFMTDRKLEVIGVRSDGIVAGYVSRSELKGLTCADCLQTFPPELVIEHTAPLDTVVLGLRDSPRLFVSVFGQVGGIVTKTDLQKPPVRMWLFGMITLIEMRMGEMIARFVEEDRWRTQISKARLHKAEELLQQRTQLNQNLSLLDCLQFSDKYQLIAKIPELRAYTRFPSRRQLEDAGKKMERLRNNLAHSQDIIATNWEALVEMAENLESLLEPPDHRLPNGASHLQSEAAAGVPEGPE